MFKSVIILLSLAVPTVANAAPVKYLCNFTGHNTPRKVDDGGFVYSKYLLNIDAENRKASVYDGLSHKLYDAPVAATLATKSNGVYRLRWKLKGVPVTITKTVDYGIPDVINTQFNMRYSVLFNPKTMQGTLSASGGGERFASAANLNCEKTTRNLVFN